MKDFVFSYLILEAVKGLILYINISIAFDVFSFFFYLGEALGAIGDAKAIEVLEKYINDPVVEVQKFFFNHKWKYKPPNYLIR